MHKIKIDQSFMGEISSRVVDQAIVTSIISMSKSLGLLTIAEGVETPTQLAFLRERGCDQVQGYYCCKPLPATEFENFMERHQSETQRAGL